MQVDSSLGAFYFPVHTDNPLPNWLLKGALKVVCLIHCTYRAMASESLRHHVIQGTKSPGEEQGFSEKEVKRTTALCMGLLYLV